MTTGNPERPADRPTPWADGSRVLHIGLPKTGTSTLQRALFEHRSTLAEQGVDYVGRQAHSYEAAVAALGKSRPWSPRGAAGEWSRLTHRVRTSSARCVVLSSEVLSAAGPAQARTIVDQLGGDVQVLVTLRAFADITGSNWQQGLRSGTTLGLDAWLQEVLADPPQTPKARKVQRRFRLERLLHTWGPVVGEDALTFVVPDPGDRTSLLHAVEGLLDLPEDTLSAARSANTSLPYPEAEFLRLFAAAVAARGGDHETWVRTVKAHRTKGELNALRTTLEPHPIRVPRWAVERANEWSRPGIEAVCASRATVVGDPAHLIVDPESYDVDPPVPDRIRVDAAAELAAVLYHAALRRPRPPDKPSRPAARTAAAPAPSRSVDHLPTRDLAVHLGRRVLARLRRR